MNDKIEKTEKCTRCQEDFPIYKRELEFLAKNDIPESDICHRCKGIQITSFFNIRKVFERKCDWTGKRLLSGFDKESPQSVIDFKIWQSDEFDPMKYATDYDFDRPFFEQLFEFFYKVPVQHNLILNGENCDYCNGISNCKDCYMSYDIIESNNILYSYGLNESNNIVECFNMEKCEYCYSSIGLEKCYKMFYSLGCESCSNSYFLADCRGCKDCFFCIGLDNQQYCINNIQYSKEEYNQKLSEFELNKRSVIEKLKEDFESYMEKEGYNFSRRIINSENCTGGIVRNSKNCHNCFTLINGEDCLRCMGQNNQDSIDAYVAGAKNSYMFLGGINVLNCFFSAVIVDSSNIYYSTYLTNCSDCFACSGLTYKKYCILNKQYSKEEYFKLRDKLIEHLKKEGVYGQFFPTKYSPAPANYSRTMDMFDIKPEDIGSRIYDEEIDYNLEYSSLPDDINDVDEKIVVDQAFKGKHSGRPFKFTKEEIAFYKKMNIPLPNDWYFHRITQIIKHWNYDAFYYGSSEQ